MCVVVSRDLTLGHTKLRLAQDTNTRRASIINQDLKLSHAETWASPRLALVVPNIGHIAWFAPSFFRSLSG